MAVVRGLGRWLDAATAAPRRSGATRDGYRDDVAGAFLAKGGIALIRVDIRGSGDSDGLLRLERD